MAHVMTEQPPDAPVETPEADPRSPNAPDPTEREVGPGDGDEDDDITRQIEEAFE
jgi:hypothetical protein